MALQFAQSTAMFVDMGMEVGPIHKLFNPDMNILYAKISCIE